MASPRHPVPGASLLLAALALALIALAEPAAARTNPHDFLHQGRPVGLELDLSRVAIQLGNDGSPAAPELPAPVLAALDGLARFDLDAAAPLHAKGLWALPLRAPGESAEIDAALLALDATGLFRHCSPILRNGRVTIVPTDTLLVTLEREGSAAALAELRAQPDLEWVREYPGADPIHLVRLDGAVVDQADRRRALEGIPGVRAVESNAVQLGMLRAPVNDPFYGSQWYLRNTGQVGSAGADARVSDAWSAETGSPAIVVAVIDTGVDVVHPDLVGQLVGGFDPITNTPPDGVPGNEEGDAHGTACAGIIGATGNNALGVSGVCWNVSIMPVKIFSGTGASAFTQLNWIVDALTWAADNGADVLSNSWGGGAASTAIESAIQHGIDTGRGGLGCVSLFAAGNADGPVEFPAAHPNAIAIGASSPCDERKNPGSCDGETWWGSCFGAQLDIVAPGVLITTTDISAGVGYTTSDYVGNFNGTSSATPLSAGVAALILSADPTLTAAEVRTILRSGADDEVGPAGIDTPGFDNNFGHGRLNAAASLDIVLGTQPPTVTGCSESSPGEVTVTWTNGQAYDAVEVRLEGATVASLPGGTTSAVLTGINGTLAQIDVLGVIGADRTTSRRCDVVLLGNARDLVWSPAGGAVNGGSELATALAANGRETILTGSLTSVPDLDAFDRVWACLGVFPSNAVLGSADAALLQDYLTNGVGGSFLYLEGADTWFFDAQHPLHALFSLNATSDGVSGGDLTTVIGTGQAGVCDLTGIDLVYTGENNWIDRLVPAGGALTIQSNSGPVYDCAVFNDSGSWITVGASYELGGFFDGASTRLDLVAALLACSGLSNAPPSVSAAGCVETGGTVTLTWTNEGTYDGVDILRGAELVASLPGTATSHSDAVLPGSYEYSIVARSAGASAPATLCSVTRPGIPVTGLACAQVGADASLSWTPPAGAGAIAVLRGGVEILLLPATATGATDPAPPGGNHAYSVVVRPEASPGGTAVESPSAGCTLPFSPTAVADFTCGPVSTFTQLSWVNTDAYDAIAILRDGLLLDTVGGGINSYLDGAVAPGVRIYELRPSIDGIEGASSTCQADLPPAPVTGLSCAGGEQSATLSWSLGATYDAIDLRRDGVTVATLAGDSTGAVDAGAPAGVRSYGVVGRSGGVEASPASCTVTVTPTAVSGLACIAGVGSATLSWTNGTTYDSIEVLQDGAALVTLPGSPSGYTDSGSPAGLRAYQVRGIIAATPSASVSCSVTVTLAPVSGLSCTSSEGTATLSWSNGATYDTIELRRDGILIETLGGTVTSHLDAAAPGGLRTYSLTPGSDGAAAVAATCDVSVAPEAIAALSCTAGSGSIGLSWTNGEVYDAIQVLRDGGLLATIAGTDTSYLDAAAPAGVRLLQLVPIIDGLSGPTASCQVDLPPASVSGLACAGGVESATLGWTLGDAYDELEVLRDGSVIATLPGTATAHTDAGAPAGSRTYTVLGRAGGVSSAAAACSVTVSPAAVTGLACAGGVGSTQLTWTNGASYDAVEVLRDGALIASLAGSATSHTDASAPAGTRVYTVRGILSGALSATVSCSSDVALPPITGLSCTGSAGAASLAWTNGAPYDAIEVRRDGVLLTTLPGSATSYLDGGAPGGLRVYTLSATGGGSVATGATCDVGVTPATVTGLTASVTDPCTRLASASWANPEAFDTIEVLLDGALLQTLPGSESSTAVSLPSEGPHTLCVRPVTGGLAASEACVSLSSPPVSAEAVAGLTCTVDDQTCIATASWSVHPTASSLVVRLDGAIVATLPGTATTVEVPLGPTLAGTISIGGENSCAEPLATAECAVVCVVPVPFVRGEVNFDGSLDISDAIRTLQVLFEGLATSCEAAHDANDDGAIDISDVITSVAAVFGAGPLPAAPYPACGTDPTSDGLSCVSHPGCP